MKSRGEGRRDFLCFAVGGVGAKKRGKGPPPFPLPNLIKGKYMQRSRRKGRDVRGRGIFV